MPIASPPKDPSPIKPIQVVDQDLLDSLSARAKTVPRRRTNHNLHELSDQVQRMLNALEPDTYVRPHRHIDPPKVELFVILRGRLAVLIFDDHGQVLHTVILEASTRPALDIPAGHWHSLIALEPGTIAFEAKEGPYVPATDKDFASWAPREGSSEAASYLAKLRATLA